METELIIVFYKPKLEQLNQYETQIFNKQIK